MEIESLSLQLANSDSCEETFSITRPYSDPEIKSNVSNLFENFFKTPKTKKRRLNFEFDDGDTEKIPEKTDTKFKYDVIETNFLNPDISKKNTKPHTENNVEKSTMDLFFHSIDDSNTKPLRRTGLPFQFDDELTQNENKKTIETIGKNDNQVLEISKQESVRKQSIVLPDIDSSLCSQIDYVYGPAQNSQKPLPKASKFNLFNLSSKSTFDRECDNQQQDKESTNLEHKLNPTETYINSIKRREPLKTQSKPSHLPKFLFKNCKNSDDYPSANKTKPF